MTTNPLPATLESLTDYRSAILDALRHARSSVQIFDLDLVDCGLESSDATNALTALFGTSPQPEVLRLLVHDTGHLERHCPRLLAILNANRHRAVVRTTAQAHRAWSQPFVIVDQERLITRFHQDGLRGKYVKDGGTDCAALRAQFESMWIAGQASSTGMSLGL